MKEYWTDTILESIVPAGTEVVRGEPIRICKFTDVARLVRHVLPYLTYHLSTLTSFVEGMLDHEDRADYHRLVDLIAELEEIAEKDTTKINRK